MIQALLAGRINDGEIGVMLVLRDMFSAMGGRAVMDSMSFANEGDGDGDGDVGGYGYGYGGV